MTIKLRKRKTDKKVEWSSDTVDNEHMGRRSSKCECMSGSRRVRIFIKYSNMIENICDLLRRQAAAFTRSPDSSANPLQRAKGRTRKDAVARTASSDTGKDTDRKEEEEAKALRPRAPAEQTLTNLQRKRSKPVAERKLLRGQGDTFTVSHHVEIKSPRCCVSNCVFNAEWELLVCAQFLFFLFPSL